MTHADISSGDALPLMESFYTIQGEGHHRGKAAYFIRLAGCDVGCVWCDVKESWNTSNHPVIEIDRIITEALKNKARLAVITGGEPLMYNLDVLTRKLKNAGFLTHIETSGAYPYSGEWDWICISPKKFKKPTSDILLVADELKVVIYNKSDFAWAEEYAAKVKSDCRLFLQPEWSRSSEMLPFIVEYVKDQPHWEISLQVHKFMNIP